MIPYTAPELIAIAEREYAFSLSEAKKAARETLVVYAFTTREDFEQYKPAAIGDGDNAVTYAATLTKALSSVPISRWARATMSYEIQPKS